MPCIRAMAFSARTSALARRCAGGRHRFVGPSPAALDLFGDKAKAKALAKSAACRIDGTDGATTLEEARAFFATLGAVAPS